MSERMSERTTVFYSLPQRVRDRIFMLASEVYGLPQTDIETLEYHELKERLAEAIVGRKT